MVHITCLKGGLYSEMKPPNPAEGPTRGGENEFVEIEKDLNTYRNRIERWVDLSPYESYLGRFRDTLSHTYIALSDDGTGLMRYRRAAIARVFILLPFIVAAMLAPMFYSYLPVAAAYCLLNAIGIVLILLGISPRRTQVTMTVLDVAVITFTIHLFGSLTSVVVVFFPLVITLATIFLGFFWGLFYAILCSETFSAIVLLEYTGVLPYSQLFGHSFPEYPIWGVPTFPLVVLIVAHIINYGSAFWTGLLIYELEIRRRASQSAVNVKNEMLAVCSHDLKNLLAIVGGFAEILPMQLAAGDSKSATASARQIQLSSNRMMELIRNLLDSARLAGGKIPLILSRFSYADLVKEIKKTQEAHAALRNVQLYFPPVDSPVVINADFSKLVQILTNLIQNAIIHTPEGGNVSLRFENEKPEKISFFISDTGPGISPEYRDILFNPIALAARRQDRTGRAGDSLGTGLGLSIAKGFIEMHGGRISVKSEPGSGTTFIVELPLTESSRH